LNQFYKNLALWVIIAFILLALFSMINQPVEAPQKIYSEFLDMIEKGEVKEVKVQGGKVVGEDNKGNVFETVILKEDIELMKLLREKGVRTVVVPPETTTWYTNAFISWFPLILLVGIWIFFMRQMQSGGGKALSFGKSKARLMGDKKNPTTFKDVAGVDEAKEELHEIIEFLKEPQKFSRLGGKIPKGVLLVGPPGTGKPCWLVPLREKPVFPFSASVVLTLWKCSWAWALPACVICLIRARKTAPASFSLTKLMLLAGTVVREWVEVMTNGNKP
jgi:cell division protease FtsH